MVPVLEGGKFVPEFREPAPFFRVTERALANELDRRVSNIVTVHRVIGCDVFHTNHPAQHGLLRLPAEFGLACAFNDEIVVGENIDDPDR